MLRRRLTLFLIVCSCCWMAASLAAQERRGRIAWRSVRGAASYRVEIRNEAGVYVVNQITAATSLTFPIEPGKYQVRVSALNRNREAETSTDWTPLEVVRRGNPEISAVQPERLPEKGGEAQLEIRGKRFAANATVVFRDGGRELPVRIVSIEAERIRVALDAGTRRPGSYRLVVTNPGEPAAERGGALKIGEDVTGFLGLGLYLGIASGWDGVISRWNEKIIGTGVLTTWTPPGGTEQRKFNFSVYLAYNAFNNIGFEAGWGVRYYPPESGSFVRSFSVKMGYVGAYYRIPFAGIFEFLPRVDLGIASTKLEIGSATISETFDSTDFFIRLGAGLRICDPLFRDVFIEISPELHLQPMAGAWMSTIGLYFRAGLIF